MRKKNNSNNNPVNTTIIFSGSRLGERSAENGRQKRKAVQSTILHFALLPTNTLSKLFLHSTYTIGIKRKRGKGKIKGKKKLLVLASSSSTFLHPFFVFFVFDLPPENAGSVREIGGEDPRGSLHSRLSLLRLFPQRRFPRQPLRFPPLLPPLTSISDPPPSYFTPCTAKTLSSLGLLSFLLSLINLSSFFIYFLND